MKIFDSLTHPTLDGTWLNPRFGEYANIDYLLDQMKVNNIYKAFAVGLKNVGAYDEEKFFKLIKTHTNLIPIAFCDNPRQLEAIKLLGYKGIKIHPRIANFVGDEDIIFQIINEANRQNLIVLYCGFLELNPSFTKKIKDAKLIYLHCGGKNFTHTYNQLIHKENILLDLSYTIHNYQKLIEQIKSAVLKFPHRFCIGSDHPEVSYQDLRINFEKITDGLDEEQKKFIAYKNLEKFCSAITNPQRK